MEKAIITNLLRKVKTLKDFAQLLNDIKIEEFGTAKHKITENQLRHFSSPEIVPRRYKTFHIRKKSGGMRDINAPCYQLRIILYILNKVFKAVYTPSKAAMGFTEERSVVTNASLHTGHHYVFNIDLENFFPSIPQARVWKRLQLPPFNFPVEIANVVAGLCCHKNEDGTKSVLPQGAATSPILTNAVCDNLDRRMLGVARHFGLHYSRYADDMTFSSMHNVYQDGSDFRKEILRIITEQGFTLNEKKTRLQRTGERQEVTGLTVNERVNVARKYVRDLRCILHVWEYVRKLDEDIRSFEEYVTSIKPLLSYSAEVILKSYIVLVGSMSQKAIEKGTNSRKSHKENMLAAISVFNELFPTLNI